MSESGAESKAMRFLEAINLETSIGFQCLALLKTRDACIDTGVRMSALFFATRDAATERTYLTLARLLDDDASSITLTSFCSYLEQNPGDCAWVQSNAARPEFPDADDAVRALARKWRTHWMEHPLRDQIKLARDKLIAHRDKKHWLDRVEHDPIPTSQAHDLLTEVQAMVNELGKVINNSQHFDLVYSMTLQECAITVAAYDCWMTGMADGSVYMDRFDKRLDEIERAMGIGS